MIKRVIITLEIKDGKPEGMTIHRENVASSLETLVMLNEAQATVLGEVAKNLTKGKSPIHVVNNSIKVPQ